MTDTKTCNAGKRLSCQAAPQQVQLCSTMMGTAAWEGAGKPGATPALAMWCSLMYGAMQTDAHFLCSPDPECGA